MSGLFFLERALNIVARKVSSGFWELSSKATVGIEFPCLPNGGNFRHSGKGSLGDFHLDGVLIPFVGNHSKVYSEQGGIAGN